MLALMLVLVAQPINLRDYLPPDAEAFDADTGLLVHRAELPDGHSIEYERPIVMLPPTLTRGEIHTSQRRFVMRAGEKKRDVGSHYFEAELLRREPLGRFGECLVIRRQEVRMDFSGSQEVVEVTEWYAKGVGLVQAQGERIVKGANGDTLRRVPILVEPRGRLD